MAGRRQRPRSPLALTWPRALTASFREWPAGAVRLGVVACLAAVVVAFVARIDDVMGLLDWRADQNASRGYLERIYGNSRNEVGSRKVIEDARLWMPPDATYRVVVGRDGESPRYYAPVVADFLRYFLLPRRESESAPWVVCFGCDTSRLGPRFRVLSRDEDVVFGRVRQ